MIPNIVVIGAGKVGSRHVQALSKVRNDVYIHVVDPDQKALDRSKKFFLSNQQNRNINRISFYLEINKLNMPIHTAIISTNSEIRRQVIEQLISTNNIKYLVLEKIAFQNIEDFDFIIQLLKDKSIQGFVNCPRRMLPDYQKLRKTLKQEKQINFSYNDTHWDFASNSIHMLDLFSFLVGNNNISVEDISLKKKIYKSKRNGFLDFKGSLLFSTNGGDKLFISDFEGSKSLGAVRIEGKDFTYIIFENDSKVFSFEKKESLLFTQGSFLFLKQSELTNIIIENLIDKDDVDLTRIEESYHFHKLILNIFSQHIKKNFPNLKGCPIT